MHTVTKLEKNSSRKSYRTNIPLRVVIDKKVYTALDWSLTGVALKDIDADLKIGQVIISMLVLQMPESAISINVKLKLENISNGRFGFSFVNLSDKNKKVLRRFVELAIEGKADVLDNVVSIYQEPSIDSPIHNPVQLDEKEETSLKRDFYSAAFKYLLFALIVFATLIALLFYNLRYSYEGTGIVMGNYFKVYPLKGGIVEKIYVHQGDEIKAKDPLIQLDTQDILYKLALLKAQKSQLQDQYKALKKLSKKDNSSSENDAYLRSILAKMNIKRKQYENAKIQYSQKLITKDRLNALKDAYLDTKIKYENAKSIIQRQKRTSPLQTDPLVLDTRKVDLKIAHQKESLKDYRLNAPVSGKVYELYAIEGEKVSPQNAIMTIWTKDEPYIQVHVPNKYISKIKIGSKADIYNMENNKHYDASVVKVGFIDEKDSSDGVDVILRSKDSFIGLKPRQRVNVMFKRGW